MTRKVVNNLVVDDGLRGYDTLIVNGLPYDLRDEELQADKSAAIVEQSEELEMVKAELAAYRDALSYLVPEAQLVAAFRVNEGGYDERARKVVETWKRIKNILDR